MIKDILQKFANTDLYSASLVLLEPQIRNL